MDDIERGLVEAIERDPDDVAAFQVYADFLSARGDLRGELATLQAAADEHPGDHRLTDAVAAHLHAHHGTYFGELRRAELADVDLTWRCGFLVGIRVREEAAQAAVLQQLLELPSVRFLARLAIEDSARTAYAGDVLARSAPPTLRRLRIGTPYPTGYDIGALDGVWSRVPALRELQLNGTIASIGAVALPRLRKATFRMTAGGAVPGEVAAADWPELEHLELWHGGSASTVAALAGRADLVTLGDLGVVNCAFANEALATIAASAIAPQLVRLSLAYGNLDDAGVAALLQRPSPFASLACVDLSGTLVSRATVARLAQVVERVDAFHMRTGGGTAYPRPEDEDDY